MTVLRKDIPGFLDDRIFQYGDLAKIPVVDNGETLIRMTSDSAGIRISPVLLQYHPRARSTALARLMDVARLLKEKDCLCELLVMDAYRRLPFVHRQVFEEQKTLLSARYPGLEEEHLLERIHQLIAVPETASHLTGGAFDVTMLRDNGYLDLGCEYDDPQSPFMQTFADGLTTAQRAYRMLLREVMMRVGFAPFNRKWWQFSYGDREWAAFYGKESAIYGQVETPE